MPQQFVSFTTNVCEAVVSYSLNGKPCKNIWGVVDTSQIAFTANALTALATSIGAWVVENLLPLQANNTVLSGVQCNRLFVPSDIYGIWQPDTPPHGGGSVSASNNVSLVTTLKTGIRGRSYQGRSYLVGVPAFQIVNQNFVQQSYANAVQAAFEGFNEWISDLSPSYQMAVLSRYAGNQPRPEGFPTVVQQWLTKTRLDTQRRRMPAEAA